MFPKIFERNKVYSKENLNSIIFKNEINKYLSENHKTYFKSSEVISLKSEFTNKIHQEKNNKLKHEKNYDNYFLLKAVPDKFASKQYKESLFLNPQLLTSEDARIDYNAEKLEAVKDLMFKLEADSNYKKKKLLVTKKTLKGPATKTKNVEK